MARRKRALKDLLTPDPTPDKQLTHPSGWCMTNHHKDCRYQFDHGKCGCECHTKTQKTQKASKHIADIASTQKLDETEYIDPRPWKR